MERPQTPGDPMAAALASSLRSGAWPGSALKSRYELKSVVASSGSCVVYLAWDHEAAQSVVVKEFRPDSLVQVDPQGQVLALSPETAPAFERGLRAFVKEGQVLQRCDHLSLVRVLDLVEANGTAYQVMPRYRGRLLMDARRKLPGPFSESALRALLDALLGAVENFHQQGGVHGGIHPAQILLIEDDRPLLLGPGAAGRAIPAPALHPLARPALDGYAPPEQTQPRASAPQGPWTDNFSLAAVARYCIGGPPAAVAGREPLAATVRRLFNDNPAVRYTPGLLSVLDAARATAPALRPQTARQFREQLRRVPVATLSAVPAMSTARPANPVTEGMAARAASAPLRAELGADRASRPAPLQPVALAVPVAAAVAAASASAAEPQVQSRAFVPMPADDAWRADPADRAAFAGARTQRVRPLKGWWWGGLAAAVLGGVGFGLWQGQDRALQVLGELRPAPAVQSAPGVRDPAAGVTSSLPSDTTPGLTPKAPPTPPLASVPPRSPTTSSTPAPSRQQPPAGAAPMPGPAAATPRQECAPRTQFALYRCMQLQCERARWSQHPQCLQFAATDSVE